MVQLPVYKSLINYYYAAMPRVISLIWYNISIIIGKKNISQKCRRKPWLVGAVGPHIITCCCNGPYQDPGDQLKRVHGEEIK